MLVSMNRLTRDERAKVLQMMAEGVSLRAISRMTGISRNTGLKLLADAGMAFAAYQDRVLVNLPCKRIQVDEIWAFCYAKEKNVPTAKTAPEQAGDLWTWTAIDADTKLVPSWLIGGRDSEYAMAIGHT
jgi:lambda repressor-like predicted transcriptional regulator